MRKLIWRIVFTLTVIDCIDAWFKPRTIAMIWSASKMRYRVFYYAQDDAYEYLAEMNK